MIGFDIGTKQSKVAYVDQAGTPSSILNARGEDTTPSAIYLSDSGEPLVGKDAPTHRDGMASDSQHSRNIRVPSIFPLQGAHFGCVLWRPSDSHLSASWGTTMIMFCVFWMSTSSMPSSHPLGMRTPFSVTFVLMARSWIGDFAH